MFSDIVMGGRQNLILCLRVANGALSGCMEALENSYSDKDEVWLYCCRNTLPWASTHIWPCANKLPATLSSNHPLPLSIHPSTSSASPLRETFLAPSSSSLATTRPRAFLHKVTTVKACRRSLPTSSHLVYHRPWVVQGKKRMRRIKKRRREKVQIPPPSPALNFETGYSTFPKLYSTIYITPKVVCIVVFI